MAVALMAGCSTPGSPLPLVPNSSCRVTCPLMVAPTLRRMAKSPVLNAVNELEARSRACRNGEDEDGYYDDAPGQHNGC